MQASILNMLYKASLIGLLSIQMSLVCISFEASSALESCDNRDINQSAVNFIDMEEDEAHHDKIIHIFHINKMNENNQIVSF